MRDGGAGGGDEGSPEPSTEKVTGTTRKCANCGQVGHIKTNKKYVCPCSQETPSEQPPHETPGGRKKRAPKDSRKWRPTVEPREGDKFWDPRCWKAGNAFGHTMEAPPLLPNRNKGKQKQVTWEDPDYDDWGTGDE